MRRVLYSPGFGAGWVTWAHSDKPEIKRFMLEYLPFVDFIEAGGDAAALEPAYNSKEADMHPLVQQFIRDFKERFPDADLPYFGGLAQLCVEAVPDGARVRVHEYDGSESLEVEGEYEGWL